jgi:hypothetical protein
MGRRLDGWMVAAPMSDIAELQSDDFQMVDRVG